MRLGSNLWVGKIPWRSALQPAPVFLLGKSHGQRSLQGTVHGTLKSLQCHNPKPLTLQHSAFFIVQHSHPYMTTGKTIFFTRWTFVGKLHSSVQFSSVTQLCLTLCDPMNCSTPGLHVHHQLPRFIQTHVHRVGDAIQPSHPLSSPSPAAPNPSQHQGLFQLVNSSHEVAKVLEFQPQHQFFSTQLSL